MKREAASARFRLRTSKYKYRTSPRSMTYTIAIPSCLIRRVISKPNSQTHRGRMHACRTLEPCAECDTKANY